MDETGRNLSKGDKRSARRVDFIGRPFSAGRKNDLRRVGRQRHNI